MDASIPKESSLANVRKEKYARPDNLKGAYNALHDAWIKYLDIMEGEATLEEMNNSLAKGGAILARAFGAVPPQGVNPEPTIKMGEVAFTETQANRKISNIPTVTINPYSSEPFALDLEISAAGSDIVFGHLARMREAKGIGIKMSTSFSLTAEGKLTSWEGGEERTTLIEVYKGGKELYALRLDNQGKVVGASKFEYDNNNQPEPAIPAIPTRENRRVFFYNKEKADSAWPEDDPSSTKVDITSEFEGNTVDLEKLDGVLKTVDDQGNLLKQPDLSARVSEVLSIRV
jgi:hypothetical protein